MALLNGYAQAVAARACAVQVAIAAGYTPARQAPLVVSAVEHEAKAREALDAAIAQAAAHMGEIASLADDVRSGKRILRADDVTLVRFGSQANFKVGVDRYRQPNLKDAKRNAELIAKRARQAWDLLDPSLSA